MRLITKTVKINEDTFAPELEVTVRVSLAPMQDGLTIDKDFYENIGKEFLSLLENK